jgi:hypothetical protein
MRPSIETLATAFRRAIEVSTVRADIVFRNFPRGSCGDASLSLSEFLRTHGFAEVDYVVGWARESGSRRSHAWLELDGTIVDITADQFIDRSAPSVFITTGRAWHARFSEEDRHPARISDYDPGTQGRLFGLYADVMAHVPSSLGGRAG